VRAVSCKEPIGHSDGATGDKADGFAKYLHVHARIVRNAQRNSQTKWGMVPGPYYFIDTNCGDGDNRCADAEFSLGSPLIFLQTMRVLGMDYEAHFIDREPANIERLRTIVGDDPHVRFYCADNESVIGDVLDLIPKRAMGMLYMDPNGVPQLELLERVSEERPKLDIMVRGNTVGIKRNLHYGVPRLVDIPQRVRKEYWLIRDVLAGDRWAWTFLIGANYKMHEWKGERFHFITTKEGQDILLKLDLTRPEYDATVSLQTEMFSAVRTRSDGLCERCGSAPATEMHHLWYGPEANPAKLIHVCHRCHCELEGKAS
jgi:hypothetical protein